MQTYAFIHIARSEFKFSSIPRTRLDTQRNKTAHRLSHLSVLNHRWNMMKKRKKQVVFILTNNFTPSHLEESKSQRVATSGMHRHAEQRAPGRPIQCHRKQRVRPHGAHVWREGHEPIWTSSTQTASSSLSETTSRRAAPGSDSGLSVPVWVYYRHPAAVWPYAHSNENVWRHLSHMKSVIQGSRACVHISAILISSVFPEFDVLILIISDVLQGNCLD